VDGFVEGTFYVQPNVMGVMADAWLDKSRGPFRFSQHVFRLLLRTTAKNSRGVHPLPYLHRHDDQLEGPPKGFVGRITEAGTVAEFEYGVWTTGGALCSYRR